jgi:hypothetical protein
MRGRWSTPDTMSKERVAMLRLDVGRYTLAWAIERESYKLRCREATALEEIGTLATAEQVGALAVSRDSSGRPVLLVVAGCDPSYDGYQLDVGALLVPETHTLFVGAFDEVFAYDLRGPTRLWRERAECGFWDWQRHDDYVLMAAELALAAWDLCGIKQWETFVEPPYDYTVADGTVHLTVMDVPVSFSLASGPTSGRSLPWRPR